MKCSWCREGEGTAVLRIEDETFWFCHDGCLFHWLVAKTEGRYLSEVEGLGPADG